MESKKRSELLIAIKDLGREISKYLRLKEVFISAAISIVITLILRHLLYKWFFYTMTAIEFVLFAEVNRLGISKVDKKWS